MSSASLARHGTSTSRRPGGNRGTPTPQRMSNRPVATWASTRNSRSRGSHTSGNGRCHRHGRAHVAEPHQPLRREEIEVDVVEGVFDDLMRVRLDPQRDERDLVHHPLNLGVPGIARIVVARHAAALPVGVQVGRIVFDAHHLVTVERLAPDQRVRAFLELEPEKIRRRDELRLADLSEQPVDASGLGPRSRLAATDPPACRSGLEAAARRSRAPRCGAGTPASYLRRSASPISTPLNLTGLRTKNPSRMYQVYSRRSPQIG